MPVSGGGMISGIAVAAKALRPGIAVVAAEPRGTNDAADVARCKEAGELLVMDKPATIADGLQGKCMIVVWGARLMGGWCHYLDGRGLWACQCAFGLVGLARTAARCMCKGVRSVLAALTSLVVGERGMCFSLLVSLACQRR